MQWIWDWAKYHNSHSSKSIRVTKLSFGQNDLPRSTPFWQKNSFVTLKLFEQWLLWYLALLRFLLNHTLFSNNKMRKYTNSSTTLCGDPQYRIGFWQNWWHAITRSPILRFFFCDIYTLFIASPYLREKKKPQGGKRGFHSHTVNSSDWTLKKRALSNFAFQHC